MPINIELIQKVPSLSALPIDALTKISKHASLISIKSGTTLFDCGSSCEMLPLVISGSIRVFKRSETSREISLYRVNKDELCIITLSCLLGGETYPATGITDTDISAITIPRAIFLELISVQPEFRDIVFHLFAERLSGLMQLVDEITFKKLDQRLAAFLAQHGPIIEESHQDIADELGSVREIISRLLKQFEENNWVKLSRKRIEITNPEALNALSYNYR